MAEYALISLLFLVAFAVASLLALLALMTLVVKSVVEWKTGQQLALQQVAAQQQLEARAATSGEQNS